MRPASFREEGDRSRAALAPRLAADLYGLDIVMEDVEDTDNNITRFVILSKTKAWAPRTAADQLMMTTFVFRVHNIPAALYKAMGGFATNGVNMTKLESYQLGGTFFATQFYADIEGHPEDPHVAQAMKELGFFSKEVRILGVLRGASLPRGAAHGGIGLSHPRPTPSPGARRSRPAAAS